MVTVTSDHVRTGTGKPAHGQQGACRICSWHSSCAGRHDRRRFQGRRPCGPSEHKRAHGSVRRCDDGIVEWQPLGRRPLTFVPGLFWKTRGAAACMRSRPGRVAGRRYRLLALLNSVLGASAAGARGPAGATGRDTRATAANGDSRLNTTSETVPGAHSNARICRGRKQTVAVADDRRPCSISTGPMRQGGRAAAGCP
jgi:hypothetical protein